ncbi:hypothetical protein ACFYXM_12370 [Streptomyces sp. NPDC002476]|uniref:hypothetical protein n=1 Tax=Streptomyces sp. NPDC002476 TaxID=3364648 RepID=UPI0036745050
MNFLIRTNPRFTTARLRLAAFVAVPVLALSVACGGGDDSAGGMKKDNTIADVPEAPATNDASTAKDGKSQGGQAAGKSEFYDAQMKYVQCMRAKGGYKDFPDPKLSGHLDWDKVNEIGAQPGRNDGIKGGKEGSCVDELRAAMAAEPKRDQQKDYESMLAHAKCMRDNGVSRFTNPTMSGGNAQPGGDPDPASPSIDSNSPTYKKAREACGPKLLDGLDGMQ